jgi:NADH-quinone oxidoreductase subunit N/multicomponent Na+:H+ antiporter subunit D
MGARGGGLVNPGEIAAAVPLFVACGGVASYLFAKLLSRELRKWTGIFAALWLLYAFGLLLYDGSRGMTGGIISGSLGVNGSALGVVLGLLVTGLGAVAAIASVGRLDPEGPIQLFYPLFLFALAGAAAVGFTRDLFTIFVMVELSSIPSYALVAYRWREEPKALSAAMKYLFQGVTGTLSALLGISLLYLAGHTLSIPDLPGALESANPFLIGLAVTLLLIGYGVKLGIVPMHTWLPDTYVIAPASVTAILIGATKAGALVALFLSLSALPRGAVVPGFSGLVVCVLAALTMTVGNLLALNQRDLRRMLAYSSVAQMGYILLGFGIGLQYSLIMGLEAGLFFAIAYGVMKAGAFLAADLFTVAAGSPDIERMRGLGATHPVIGCAFAIFILGLIGMPATGGFLGKLLVFQAGMTVSTVGGVALALILAGNSALSLGYYVPVLSTILFRGHPGVHEPARAGTPTLALSISVSIVVLALAIVYLGLFPATLFDWISRAAGELFTWGVR